MPFRIQISFNTSLFLSRAREARPLMMVFQLAKLILLSRIRIRSHIWRRGRSLRGRPRRRRLNVGGARRNPAHSRSSSLPAPRRVRRSRRSGASLARPVADESFPQPVCCGAQVGRRASRCQVGRRASRCPFKRHLKAFPH